MDPNDRKYTKEHEWIKVDAGIATIGITDTAQSLLTDVVFVELPEVGNDTKKSRPFCILESVKSVSDVYAPANGRVIEVNTLLETNPELINQSPYDKGWIAKIELNDPTDIDDLMDAPKYKTFAEEK